MSPPSASLPRTRRRFTGRASLAAILLLTGLGVLGSAPAFASSTPPGPLVLGAAQLPPRMSIELAPPIMAGADDPAVDSDAPEAESAEGGAEPAVCSGCTPPLTQHGGAIMGTTAQAGAITITPIYWVPSGYTMAPAYKSLINQYISDVAHDSGTGSNVFAINAEYSRATTPAGGDQIRYAITAGTPITDTTAYPAPASCTPDAPHTGCVTDGDLRTRLSALLQANALPADLAHIYPVFFPGGVDFVNSGGKHKDAAFCAYHGRVRVIGPRRAGHLRRRAVLRRVRGGPVPDLGPDA